MDNLSSRPGDFSRYVAKMKPTAEHSFPDAEVTGWHSSPTTLEIAVSNVLHDGQLHGSAAMRFPLVRPATAMWYDHENNRWLTLPDVEPLKDICEFHHKSRNLYSLKGFGSITGKWIAVSVVSDSGTISWSS